MNTNKLTSMALVTLSLWLVACGRRSNEVSNALGQTGQNPIDSTHTILFVDENPMKPVNFKASIPTIHNPLNNPNFDGLRSDGK